MNGKLVDTNVVIRFVKGTTELFSLFDDIEKLYISSISVGELMYGCELSSKSDSNREIYSGFCSCMNVLCPDEKVAAMYGKVKAQLKKAGHPIPENDIWIAATAMAGDLLLITVDKDFEGIQGLKVNFI